jgi:monothiol glutaredoxin
MGNGWHLNSHSQRFCVLVKHEAYILTNRRSAHNPGLLFTEIPMPRPILDEAHIHPAIREKIATHQQAIVQEVQAAVAQHAVVVVGMGMNPFPKKARRALDAAGVTYQYLEYGNYFSRWRQRNALKLWTGWPTLPMVFVRGTLIGGAGDLARLIASGELKIMLA